MKNLKPCPWCGTTDMLAFDTMHEAALVSCVGCGCAGPWNNVISGQDPAEVASNAWNDRQEPEEPTL